LWLTFNTSLDLANGHIRNKNRYILEPCNAIAIMANVYIEPLRTREKISGSGWR
jgi:hypothetical protein